MALAEKPYIADTRDIGLDLQEEGRRDVLQRLAKSGINRPPYDSSDIAGAIERSRTKTEPAEYPRNGLKDFALY